MTTNTTFTAKKIEEQRFEFVLFINNHIVCQRYFNIRDFNPDILRSLDLKELMDTITGVSNNGIMGDFGIIPKFLKNNSVNFLWESYNPYDPQIESGAKNTYEKVDDFQFEIKIDKNVVAQSSFSGNLFQPKVRYAVQIKEIIHSIMAEIRHFFSQKKYNKVEANALLEDIYTMRGF